MNSEIPAARRCARERRAPRVPLFRAARGARAGLCALGLACALLGAPGAAPAADFAEALERFEQADAVRGARLGVLVIDLRSGETLLAKDDQVPMVPASSQKLFVASAALARWGPAHRFTTPIYAEGGVNRQGAIEGRLWIAGRGDPSLVSESLWKLAEELRLRGVREIRGGIGIDAGYFDRAYIHPDWEPVGARAYHAPISAFSANFSAFRVEVAPGPEADAPVVVAVAPSTRYFRVESRATTVTRGGRLQLDVDLAADGSSERVAVAGSMSEGARSSTYWRSVSAPELYAASVLRSQLEAQGIRVQGSIALGTLPAGLSPLLEFEGEPLGLIVRDMNKYSNNFIAEQLTKGLGADAQGAPGSWESGTAAIRSHLGGLGLLDAGTLIADGSGLSPRNRVTPRMLVGVLQDALEREPWAPEYLASLPLAGRDGTLEERLREPADAVRAKTGHLRSVSSLAGIVRGAGARRLLFAVLVNGGPGEPAAVDRAIDAFVGALREGEAEPPAPQPSPAP